MNTTNHVVLRAIAISAREELSPTLTAQLIKHTFTDPCLDPSLIDSTFVRENLNEILNKYWQITLNE